MRDDQQFQKWCKWLRTIADEVHQLYFYRDVFDGLVRIVDDNDRIQKDTLFFTFLWNIYFDSMAMGVRRQLKCDRSSISLIRLLREVARSPHLVTRDDFYELWTGDFWGKQALMERDFALFAEPGAPSIEPARVQKDIEQLRTTCSAVEKCVDRRIAHSDPRPLTQDVNLRGVMEALDKIGELVKRYFVLFFATNLELYPVPQESIFHIFGEAWLVPGMENLRPDDREKFKGILAAHHYPVDDFDVAIKRAMPEGTITDTVPGIDAVRVRRKSSGVVQRYPNDSSDAAWIRAFEEDLDRGDFGKP